MKKVNKKVGNKIKVSPSDDLDKSANNSKRKVLKTKSANDSKLISLAGTPHNAFLLSLKNKSTSIKSFISKLRLRKFKRPVKYKKRSDSFIEIINLDDRMLCSNNSLIHPEAVAFLFNLDGCSKNLLFYLILNQVNVTTCKYSFNQHVIDEFREHASTVFYTDYKNETIKQAHRTLVERNLTSNVSRGIYSINHRRQVRSR